MQFKVNLFVKGLDWYLTKLEMGKCRVQSLFIKVWDCYWAKVEVGEYIVFMVDLNVLDKGGKGDHAVFSVALFVKGREVGEYIVFMVDLKVFDKGGEGDHAVFNVTLRD